MAEPERPPAVDIEDPAATPGATGTAPAPAETPDTVKKAAEMGKKALAAAIPLLRSKIAKRIGLVLLIAAASAVAASYGIDAYRDFSNSRITAKKQKVASETPKNEIEFDIETQMDGKKMNVQYPKIITIDECGKLHNITSFELGKKKLGKGKFYFADATIMVKTHDGKILTYTAEKIAADKDLRPFHITATLTQ